MAPDSSQQEPVVRPVLVRALRERPKLVDVEARDRVLEQIEMQIASRRTPDNIAEALSRQTLQQAADLSQPVVRDAMRSRLDRANSNLLRGL